MRILNVTQGTPEWLSARAKYHTASEAPAMMGASKYQTRSELVAHKATGTTRTVDASTQARFDNGHAVEKLARPLVEQMLGEDLYPITAVDDSDTLLASFDGMTMDESIIFEHKAWNKDLAAQVQAGELEPHYYWQLEQQLLVSGAEKVVFVCSDGTQENFVSMEYRAVPGRAAALMAGWKQFAEDVANYVPEQATPTPTAEAQMDLPAVSVQVNGSIAIIDNLARFGDALTAYVERINKAPQTDDDFATLEAQAKSLKRAEDSLKAAEDNALGQAADIDHLRKTVAYLRDVAKQARLSAEKIVKAEKENRKNAIVKMGIDSFVAFRATLEASRFPPEFRMTLPDIPADFYGAAKGLKTIASIENAVKTELARVKIAASELADKIAENLRALLDHEEHKHLFADYRMLAIKDADSLKAIIDQRIATFTAEQARKAEAEREKIRVEEEAKARAKIEAEQKAEQARIATEHAQATVAQNGASSQPATTELLSPVEAAAHKPAAVAIGGGAAAASVPNEEPEIWHQAKAMVVVLLDNLTVSELGAVAEFINRKAWRKAA